MNEYIRFLKEVVVQASQIIKKDFSVSKKGENGDIVTNMDYEIESFLINKIKTNYPDFDIISEESNFKQEITDNCFIIDPIDGTINFANGIPLWSIQASCIKNGKRVAAVIYMPLQNEIYWADENKAYLNEEQIAVKQVPIKNALYSIDGDEDNIKALKNMRNYSFLRMNLNALCVSLAYVAAGRMHGAVFTDDRAWDYEPGMHIAHMAGAAIHSENGLHVVAMNKEFLNILKKSVKDN